MASARNEAVALVTGAATGLGRLIAEELHQSGYRVVFADRDFAAARGAATALDRTGLSTAAVELDVLQKDHFLRALDRIASDWAVPQVLVNNAALTLTTSVMSIEPEEFTRVLDVNLRGTFLGCQVLGAAMAEQGRGRIINVSSLAGQNGGTASGAHYASSKAGIVTLTKVFARELSPKGVTVNAIAPGPLDLPSVRAAVPADRLEKIVEQIPVRRLGNPRFIARLAVLLASADADSATGATWDVNGGLFMR